MNALLPIAVVTNPHFERLGGLPAVRQLAQAFYRAMDTRPDAQAIRAMHAGDLGPAQAVLESYLAEWLGGPRLYTGRGLGPPRLRRVHQPFPIDAAARDAWLACMQQALALQPWDEALKTRLLGSFFETADWMRNQPG